MIAPPAPFVVAGRQRRPPPVTVLAANINFVNNLKKLDHQDQIKAALKEFNGLVLARSLEPNLRTYHAILTTLRRFNLVNEAWPVAEEMLTRFRPTCLTYSILINLAGATGDVPRALRLYQEALAQTDLDFQIGLFNSMLTVITEHNSAMSIWHVVEDFKKRDIVPDGLTLSTLIKAARKRPNEASKVVQVMNVMYRHGWKPEPLTLNSVVRMCCRVGDLETAEASLDRLRKLGLTAHPVTWNVIILSFGLYGGVAAMEAKYEEMLKNGITPATPTYNERINVYGRFGLWDRALAALAEMKEKGLQPDGYTYIALAHVYRRMGDAEKLDQTRKELEEYAKRTGFRIMTPKMRALFLGPVGQDDGAGTADQLKEELLHG